MRVLRLIPVAAFVALLVACGAEPLNPADAMPSPAFARAGTDRPFSAFLPSTVTWEYDWSDPVCPITTKWSGTGNATHLGTVFHTASHCAAVTLPTYESGHWEIIAPNGDKLVLEYGGWPANLPVPLPLQVVGGTGRFADASGTVYLVDFAIEGEWGEDGNPIEPWYAWHRLEGTISY
jgi:hypothetical protein